MELFIEYRRHYCSDHDFWRRQSFFFHKRYWKLIIFFSKSAQHFVLWTRLSNSCIRKDIGYFNSPLEYLSPNFSLSVSRFRMFAIMTLHSIIYFVVLLSQHLVFCCFSIHPFIKLCRLIKFLLPDFSCLWGDIGLSKTSFLMMRTKF